MTIDELASAMNKLRIFPRILVLACTIYIGFYAWGVTYWYMMALEPSIQDAAFAGSVVTLLGTILKFILDKYMSTGSND